MYKNNFHINFLDIQPWPFKVVKIVLLNCVPEANSPDLFWYLPVQVFHSSLRECFQLFRLPITPKTVCYWRHPRMKNAVQSRLVMVQFLFSRVIVVILSVIIKWIYVLWKSMQFLFLLKILRSYRKSTFFIAQSMKVKFAQKFGFRFYLLSTSLQVNPVSGVTFYF